MLNNMHNKMPGKSSERIKTQNQNSRTDNF